MNNIFADELVRVLLPGAAKQRTYISTPFSPSASSWIVEEAREECACGEKKHNKIIGVRRPETAHARRKLDKRMREWPRRNMHERQSSVRRRETMQRPYQSRSKEVRLDRRTCPLPAQRLVDLQAIRRLLRACFVTRTTIYSPAIGRRYR